MENLGSLLDNGARFVKDGETILATDFQILGHKDNQAISPPEYKWIGWKKLPYAPHPTFIRK